MFLFLESINRSKFYASYIYICDLPDEIKKDMFIIYWSRIKMFQNIYENQLYYKALLKLGFNFSEYYDNRLKTKKH